MAVVAAPAMEVVPAPEAGDRRERRKQLAWNLAALAAHVEMAGRGRAGHEKQLPFVWEVADYGDPAAPPPAGVDPGELRAARHALTCGDLRELTESVRAPMSWHRFWKNLTGAPRRTALRLPANPYQAERRFC